MVSLYGMDGTVPLKSSLTVTQDLNFGHMQIGASIGWGGEEQAMHASISFSSSSHQWLVIALWT